MDDTDKVKVVGLAPLLGTKHADTKSILGFRQSSFVALFNVVCTMAGSGILQLPFTLRQGGWLGVIVLFIVGVMCCYTARCVIHCLYYRGPDDRLSGYPQIGFAAFGAPGRAFVHVFHKATLFGVCTLYFILSSKFLAEAFAPAEHEDYWIRKLVLVCAGFVMIPCLLLPTMKEVGFLSAFGMFASILVVVVCLAYSLAHRIAHPHLHPSYTTIDFDLFPSAFSAITLSFGGHSVMPTIERHTAGPSQFLPILNTGFAVLMAMYIPTAVAGYWAYGNHVYSPILCNFPRSAVVPTISKVVVAFHCLAAYPILMNVIFTEIQDLIFNTQQQDASASPPNKFVFILKRSVLRASIISLSACVAYFVPYFPQFMTLVGACCITMMVFVLPIVFNFRLRGHLLMWPEKVWGVLVLVTGLLGGVNGAWQAMRDMIHLLSHNASPSQG